MNLNVLQNVCNTGIPNVHVLYTGYYLVITRQSNLPTWLDHVQIIKSCVFYMYSTVYLCMF